MPKLPIVTVLIPASDSAALLPRAIESVLTQGYPRERLQVVVVDDGSVDDTAATVRPYLGSVTYLRQDRRGRRGTVNRLLAAASGQLIALQPVEAWWAPGSLKAHVRAFGERPALGLLYESLRAIDPEERMLAESLASEVPDGPGAGVMTALLRDGVVPAGILMARTALRERFDPLPEFVGREDWWIATRIAQVAELDTLTPATAPLTEAVPERAAPAPPVALAPVATPAPPVAPAPPAPAAPDPPLVPPVLPVPAAPAAPMVQTVGVGLRAFVTVADGAELIDNPALLGAYGALFDGGDDASLVVRVPAGRVEDLARVVALAGLAGGGAAELIGVDARFAVDADAVLSAHGGTDATGAVPRADAGSIRRLRALAEQRWAAAPR